MNSSNSTPCPPTPSWGRYPVSTPNTVVSRQHRNQRFQLPDGDESLLPRGNGRSYGDSCLNNGGQIVQCRGMDHFIAFDDKTGVLRCEAGVLLSEILKLVVSRGWFLPVTPGTKFVTVGGAIANDVHGKNHHIEGTFGRHLRCFELLRSDGARLHCSKEQNEDLFAATIGGLGLTGIVTWAEIQLKPVTSAYLDQETIKFGHLSEFFRLSAESEQSHEYTVSWVDCTAKGSQLGRGLFSRANHAQTKQHDDISERTGGLSFPLELPLSLINQLSVKAFNTLYYHKQRSEKVESRDFYDPFFYPLDAIQNWNRMYGRKGFLQYQCVVDMADAEAAVAEMLARIAAAGSGSFLAVLKIFGDVPSPGMLSFPRPGATLALDFPFSGDKTFALLNSLDEVVQQAGGAIYPAKDARMSGDGFKHYYPRWQEFNELVDPAISSSFWRRVMD